MENSNKTINLLVAFVNQKSGLDFNNYGDISSFRKEQREISKDKQDFSELLTFAFRRITDLDSKLESYLKATSGRLLMPKDGQLEYITGQYFCTEYRPAANSVLSHLIWVDFRDEKDKEGNNLYTDGYQIRKSLARSFSRRVTKNYFN